MFNVYVYVLYLISVIN